MSKNLRALAKELKIPVESLMQFIQDFDLEVSDCISCNQDIKINFENFAKDHQSFIKDYSDDLSTKKTIEDVANKAHQPIEKIQEYISQQATNIFENGYFKTSISSFGIDKKLGGNYQFIYDYFGAKTALEQRDFIGYRDLYFYIVDMLEPFINPDQSQNWGIEKAAGIILYGPPGSGKIFWARKIAEIINYKFEEIRHTYLKTSFVNGKKTSFNDFLLTIMKKDKMLLFMENFDTVMQERSEQESINSENEETKNIILHSVDKFQQEDLTMIGSAKSFSMIDPEIIAPGRFDVLIPIFPPNSKERAEMILHHMQNGLTENATLLKILQYNQANQLPFWNDMALKMKAFSNTMLVDFTQSLKKRLRTIFLKNHDENITIDDNILNSAYKEAASKLTSDYLNDVQQFLQDASINSSDQFESRISQLKEELQFYMIKEKPSRSIGFNTIENNNNPIE